MIPDAEYNSSSPKDFGQEDSFKISLFPPRPTIIVQISQQGHNLVMLHAKYY